MIGPQRCGGSVAYDADGNFIERYACEVHLFGEGPCGWQTRMFEERENARAEARTGRGN